MNKTIRLHESPYIAPQGEGFWAGMPMVFVRLQGCNLRCEFCDTKAAIAKALPGQGSLSITTEHLAESLVGEYGKGRVACLTGGEPLLQAKAVAEVAEELHRHGWKVHVETNGTLGLTVAQGKWFDWITVSPKGPTWALCLPPAWVKEFKFVMPPEDEYWSDIEYEQWASPKTIQVFVDRCPTALLWFQPRNNEPEAIEWCLKRIDAYQTVAHPAPLTVGLSVQMHKFIGVN